MTADIAIASPSRRHLLSQGLPLADVLLGPTSPSPPTSPSSGRKFMGLSRAVMMVLGAGALLLLFAAAALPLSSARRQLSGVEREKAQLQQAKFELQRSLAELSLQEVQLKAQLAQQAAKAAQQEKELGELLHLKRQAEAAAQQQQRAAEKQQQQSLQQVLDKLPAAKDSEFDSAAAATGPVGQMLANMAAAGQDVWKLRSQLAPVLAYRHSLPAWDLLRSNVFVGSGARLRRVVRDLLTGDREVHVGVIGGSISWGHGASNAPVNGWFALVGACRAPGRRGREARSRCCSRAARASAARAPASWRAGRSRAGAAGGAVLPPAAALAGVAPPLRPPSAPRRRSCRRT
jgi:hypothetical protein